MPSIEAKCEAKCRVGLRWCRAPRGPDAESVTHSGKNLWFSTLCTFTNGRAVSIRDVRKRIASRSSVTRVLVLNRNLG
jgi:hypothetical protein